MLSDWWSTYRTRGTPLRRWVNGTLMVAGIAALLWFLWFTFRVALIIDEIISLLLGRKP
jgi:hypothetical protein